MNIYNHCETVAKLCKEFSLYLGNSYQYSLMLYQAGIYHDIGKIKLQKNTLNKVGPLTIEEWNHIKKHVIYSKIIAKSIGVDINIVDIVYQHHEEEDGCGYPNGLRGNQILTGAKILKICDVYISLREKRPYRESFELDETIKIMDQMEEEEKLNSILYSNFKNMVLESSTLKKISNG
ncbi:MAG: HD domain-containing protein [Nanoarchaeota archaeon]|nr:HD domain-containing protein [Nanoarchaeota archaeon]